MRSDVLIVGGGLLGAAVAWHCAQRGQAVRVLDRGEPGGGSSSRAFGLVDVLTLHPPGYLRARSEAIAETAAWLRGAGALRRVAWNPCGSLNPDLGPAALPLLAAAGVEAQWWDAERLRAEEPALSAGSAVHLPADACLDPPQYLAAVREAAIGAGVVWEQAEAAALRQTPDGWTAAGRSAPRAVLAAGVWSPLLLPGLPLEAVRGTILETAALPPLLRRYTPVLRQLPSGSVWIGGSQERAGYRLDPEPGVVAALERAGRAALPALRGVPIRAVRTGLRPVPADGLPLAGPWPGCEGLFVCVAHSGVTMAQWLGRRLSALLGGQRVPELAPFQPARG